MSLPNFPVNRDEAYAAGESAAQPKFPVTRLEQYLAELAESAADKSLGITGAAVGDILTVAAVDGDGKPTAWAAVSEPDVSQIGM